MTGRSRWWVPVSFFAAAFLLFGPSIGGEFVLDGTSLVRDNPSLARFEPFRIATLDWWAGTGKPGGLYRPVALVWLALMRALGGGSPAILDFFNVVLHALVGWVRYAMLMRLLGRDGRSAAVAWLASLFALVHPIGVEVVAGQVGASDLLAALFATLAVTIAAGTRRLRFVAAGALAALASLSKESGVVVLAMAVLFEALRHDSAQRLRRMALAAAWSGAGVAIALVCRVAALGSLSKADEPVYAGFATVDRLASACATFGTYLAPLVVAPWRQLATVSLQDAWPAEGFGDWRALIGLASLLLLAAGPILALRRSRPAIAFGSWIFLVSWLPASNLFFSSGAVAASRFLYAGLVGLTLVLAIVVVDGWTRGRVPRAVSIAVTAWFGVAMAVVTARELPAWQSLRALYEAQVARAPGSVYPLVDLATLLAESDPGRASRLFQAAVDQPRPQIPRTPYPPEDLHEAIYIAHLGLGKLEARRGDDRAGRAEFEAAAQDALLAIEASRTIPYREDWAKHRALAARAVAAAILDQARRAPPDARSDAALGAERWLNLSEELDPLAAESVQLRSVVLELRGDPAGQRNLIEAAWHARPGDPLLRSLWAAELRKSGRSAEAVALEIDVVLETLENANLQQAQRALAVGQDAITHREAAVREKGRRVLSEIVRHAPDRAMVETAVRALATARRD